MFDWRLLKFLLQSTGADWDEEFIAYAISELNKYNPEQVNLVLKKLITTHKYKITLADILNQLPARAGDWLPADEAWAIALQLQNEEKSVVTFAEIGEAWGFVCDIYNDGDKIEAKRMFERKYNELITNAQQQKRRPSWYISYGTDISLRAEAEKEAVRRGLIKIEKTCYLNNEPAGQIEALTGNFLKNVNEIENFENEEYATGTQGAEV